MKELEKIIDLLGSTDISILRPEEVGLISLAETYSKHMGFKVLSSLITRIKQYRVDVNGRRRNDLKQIALSMRVNVLAQSRLTRQAPIVDSEILENILRGEVNE